MANLTTNTRLVLGDTIVIEEGTIEILASVGPDPANTRVTLAFYGLPYSECPMLLRDGVRCDNDGTCNASYADGRLFASAPGIGRHRVVPAP